VASDRFAVSERLGQAGLTQDSIGGVSAGIPIGTAKVSPRDRAIPDFMAAAALADQAAASARSKSRNARSNCGAIQAAADSASRSAVICTNSEVGSISG
jgi:isochorismate hydrolase